MNKTKWKLECRIYPTSLNITKYFDTRKDAYREFRKYRSKYTALGYKIWYAYLTDRKGNKRILEVNGYDTVLGDKDERN